MVAYYTSSNVDQLGLKFVTDNTPFPLVGLVRVPMGEIPGQSDVRIGLNRPS